MLDYRARRKAAHERWLARKEQIAEAKALRGETIRFKLPERKQIATEMVDGEPMAVEQLDSAAFKMYVAEVEKVLKDNDGLMTVREIRAALGDRLIELWLLDALAMSHHVLHVPAFIDRFAYVEIVEEKPPVTANGDLHLATVGGAKWPTWQEFN